MSSRPTSTGAIPKTYQPGDQYDSLVAQLQINHPSLNQEQARWYVREVRQSNNGKLSGMKRKDIFNKVASFVQRDTGSVDGARFIESDRSIVDSASFAQRDRGSVDGACFMQRDEAIVDVVDEEDNNCSICLEDMLDSDSLYLNPCRHRL